MFSGLSSLWGSSSKPNLPAQRPQGGYKDRDAQFEGYGQNGPANHMLSVNAPVASPHVEETDEATEREDLLDQHVAYYLKHHPEVHAKHNLTRIRPGVYSYDGREISVEWHYSEDPEQPGFLVAVDGPLRQPFADYMQENEHGIEWDVKRLGKSSLSQIPKGKRMSFGDGNKVYSRLEAMKVAKEQALVREKAADYMKDGRMVPQQELMDKYERTISQKLGNRRQRQQAPQAAPAPAPPQAQAESPVPCAAPAPAPSPAPAKEAAPPAAKGKAQQTHGHPKYCAKHDKTEKRKKTKPQNLPCSACGQVIQTNYVEFTLCPTCSEKDHRCMCCGAAAVGAPSPPHANHQAPSSPMNARSSGQNRPSSKSPAGGHDSAGMMPSLNIFGMPDLFGNKQSEQNSGPPALQPMPMASGAWQGVSQGVPGSIVTPQNNAFASQRGMAAQQNPYASQNAYASYNPMASHNVMVGRR